MTARNVAELRSARGYSVRALADRLDALGHPMLPSAITKIEKGARRVSVADLVALAVALDVSPPRLIMPPERTDEPVQVTPARSATWEAAWRWATGDQPLLEHGERLPLDDKRVRRFVEDNRPYELRPVEEAAIMLAKREPPPFTARIRHDVRAVRGTLTYGDEA